MADSLPVYKIALMGRPGVGKSALAQKFLGASHSSVFPAKSTVIYQKKAHVKGKDIQVSVADSPGFTDASRLQKSIIDRAEGFIIVFSVTDADSFNAVSEYRNHIIKVKKDDNIPIILVANKCESEDWAVTQSEISEKAKELNIKYIETSTITPRNVDKPFLEVAKMISEYQPLPDQGRQRSCCEIL